MVTYQYAPVMDGGAERQAQRLAEALAGRGRRVAVVTSRYPGLRRTEMVGSVELHRVWAVPRPNRLSITFLPSLTAFLLRHGWRFDIWHVHQAYYNAWVALRLARLLGKRCVVKAAASGPYGDVARLRGARFGRWVLQTLPSANAVVSLNGELTKELIAAGVPPGRIRMIANGVDCKSFRPASSDERMAARSALRVPSGATLAVYAGRLSVDKGVDTLIDAWRLIEGRPDSATWHLLVAGDGPQAQQYRSAASDLRRARFLGQLPDIWQLLAAADVVVHPSLTEGISNIVLEAMAVGLPVVASQIGVLTEQVDPGTTGLLVPPQDAQLLADNLGSLLEDESRRAHMGEAARRAAETRFGLGRMVDAYERLYSELAP
jgi:glycosyltransferase involved in cell wall biosynthesis